MPWNRDDYLTVILLSVIITIAIIAAAYLTGSWNIMREDFKFRGQLVLYGFRQSWQLLDPLQIR
jgi:hypothetical protein